ncbi:MAG: DUF433 domain-containing protein [Rhodomicrobium sp.]
MSELHRITSNPAVLAGNPTVRGLWISVSDILDLLAEGADRAEILANYPYLEDGDITAALEYASRSANHTVIKAANDREGYAACASSRLKTAAKSIRDLSKRLCELDYVTGNSNASDKDRC